MSGCLTLVSLGPGDLDYLPPIARRAIESAGVVIGYRLYVDLVRPLLTSEQKVIESVMGGEMERAAQAIDLAIAGERVALVSSGDVGIYAMAGSVYEALRRRGWMPGTAPEVQVIPGISAMQAAAARLGAPIAHDFSAISLSDLHVDWATIARRIDMAGRGDFVIAFYNPRSRDRDWQLMEARRLLLEYRAPETPVALARDVMRPTEQITVTTLGALDVTQVDMFMLVIVGNSQTVHLGNQMATPRGFVIPAAEQNHPVLTPDNGRAQSYPVTFTNFSGTLCIVIGGGTVAERKTRNLLAAGGRVRLISPQVSPSLYQFAENGEIEWVARCYRPGDIAGAQLAFAATNDRNVNASIGRECHSSRIPVNVADAPAEGTFTLPAMARQDGLAVAFSTDDFDHTRAVRARDRFLARGELP